MSERAPKSNETLSNLPSPEHAAQPKSPEARAEILKDDEKKRAEHLEAARAKLDKQAEPAAKASENEKPASITPPTGIDKLRAYRDTMQSLQHKLKPASRRFSKVIHTPVIEKTSEVVGATVARPSVTLGATTTAAIVGGVMYWASHYYGFELSGSELLFALLLGGIIGFLIELAVRAFGRRGQ